MIVVRLEMIAESLRACRRDPKHTEGEGTEEEGGVNRPRSLATDCTTRKRLGKTNSLLFLTRQLCRRGGSTLLRYTLPLG